MEAVREIVTPAAYQRPMWRSFYVAMIAYGCGHPVLDGYRPAALDAPLQAFHQQVNKAGQEGQQLLASINDARASYFRNFMGRAEKQLRAAKSPSIGKD